MITISLSWPPTLNTYWRHVGSKVLLSKGGKLYRHRVSECVFLIPRDPRYLNDERLDVHLACYPPDKRKRDLDNLPKGILDSLQHAGVYQDDSQIDKLTIERMEIRKPGEVIVTIREIQA